VSMPLQSLMQVSLLGMSEGLYSIQKADKLTVYSFNSKWERPERKRLSIAHLQCLSLSRHLRAKR
jgi:hypothetical protein